MLPLVGLLPLVGSLVLPSLLLLLPVSPPLLPPQPAAARHASNPRLVITLWLRLVITLGILPTGAGELRFAAGAVSSRRDVAITTPRISSAPGRGVPCDCGPPEPRGPCSLAKTEPQESRAQHGPPRQQSKLSTQKMSQ